ncbi:hypothetical protein ARMSODRAFT_962144 [Armillaria solidipes]|uniref:Uncharacterized protein n=1 Tax=Armillaria solidipes TaxID=1076256 RepID=A0A2H3BBB3_9AGAR|nr:hypothetical protein ARMSODRAFT_962144 [Armillaria solidipes]
MPMPGTVAATVWHVVSSGHSDFHSRMLSSESRHGSVHTMCPRVNNPIETFLPFRRLRFPPTSPVLEAPLP